MIINKATTFEELDWHDAVLLSLSVDRGNPGRRDEVLLIVEWPNGVRQNVRFTGCYAFDAQMSFGVIAPESVRSARCISCSPKLDEIRHRWAALGVDLGNLLCFEITTNSTASVIRVFGQECEVFDIEAMA